MWSCYGKAEQNKVDEKPTAIELLACYGCRYKDDCKEPFEHGRPMCDEQHVDAVEFAKRLTEDLEEE